MTVDDPSRVDGWMAGTPPPVILRHDRGLRRGEAAGFNTRRKASDSVMRACPPAIKGQPAATMTIISTLLLVPPHASKTNGNSDSSPFTPDNIHHKRKKDQDLRPSFFSPHTRQGSSLRSQRCPLKGPTATRLLAEYKRLYVQYTMIIAQQSLLGKKTKAFGLDVSITGLAG